LEIAADFEINPTPLSKWLRVADVEDGVKPGVSSDQLAKPREERIRTLEPENQLARQVAAYLSQANLPGKRSTRVDRRPPERCARRARRQPAGRSRSSSALRAAPAPLT
jgi:transposase